MRTPLRLVVDVAAPAPVVWDYVTDWPAQGEWIPQTRVERVPVDAAADRVGGRLRAWTGLGPLGFWDTMTITGWSRDADGGGVCEVLHTGRVVRGEGVFAVEHVDAGHCRFVWSEILVLPAGRAGAVGWKAVGPVFTRLVGTALEAMRVRVEEAYAARDSRP
ncbi:MAG: SRPBCC family protein [Actinomycetes bacterium]